MDPQELNELLDAMMFEVMKLRAQQVQLLAESHRQPEDKIPLRLNGNESWKRYKELHQQLADTLLKATST